MLTATGTIGRKKEKKRKIRHEVLSVTFLVWASTSYKVFIDQFVLETVTAVLQYFKFTLKWGKKKKETYTSCPLSFGLLFVFFLCAFLLQISGQS